VTAQNFREEVIERPNPTPAFTPRTGHTSPTDRSKAPLLSPQAAVHDVLPGTRKVGSPTLGHESRTAVLVVR